MGELRSDRRLPNTQDNRRKHLFSRKHTEYVLILNTNKSLFLFYSIKR